jgi:FkbM family methyltransferase
MFRKLLPFSLKKEILDMLQPNRPGIGPVLRRMDRDKQIIFDIGANVGDISCYMLHYFPNATVFGFEPCTETYNRLLLNVATAGFTDRFRAYKLGFFDKETEGTLHITSFHGANSLLPPQGAYSDANPHISAIASEQVPLMKLDDFVEREGIDRIDLVKVDVEGVEQQILRGGVRTFSEKVQTVIMEMSMVRMPPESGEFIKLFELMHEFGFMPTEMYDLEHNETSGGRRLSQFDCVFTRYRP